MTPSGKRSEGKRHEHRRRPEGEARQRPERAPVKRRPEGEVQDLSKAQHLNPRPKPQRDARPRPENQRPDSQKGDRAKFQQPPREEKRDKVFDPDSPFAKLAALRDGKAN